MLVWPNGYVDTTFMGLDDVEPDVYHDEARPGQLEGVITVFLERLRALASR